MLLKQRITNELKSTGAPNIDKMLQLMEKHGYYERANNTHNSWKGGAAQHMWAVYLMAKSLRDSRMNEPNIKKYATDKKLAIVCLLHDLGKMRVPGYNDRGHENRSYRMMCNLGVGTKPEQYAVRDHMKSRPRTCHDLTPQERDEYLVLQSLVHDADCMASGTAWNSTRFKQGRTQHHGVSCNNGYLRAVAMDRSLQSGKYHRYMDQQYELREFHNYNRDHVKWNCCEEIVRNLKDESNKIGLDGSLDVISAAHEHYQKTGERLCLVVGVCPEIPQDNDSRLRRGWTDEQDILICSNILLAFYHYQSHKSANSSNNHRYEFTMNSIIKSRYRTFSKKRRGIYLQGATIIRDGVSRGFPFVEPWDVDLLLVPGKRFPMFAIKAV